MRFFPELFIYFLKFSSVSLKFSKIIPIPSSCKVIQIVINYGSLLFSYLEAVSHQLQ